MMGDTIKQTIYEYVRDRDHVSFVELRRLLGDVFVGEWNMLLAGYPTIVLWIHMSDTVIDALEELMSEKKIVPQSANYLVYLIDGGTLSLPLAKRIYNYKKKRWLPVTFTIFKETK